MATELTQQATMQQAVQDHSTKGSQLPVEYDCKRPSFAFSKKHGIVVDHIAGGVAHVLARHNVTPVALTELRRFLGKPVQLEMLDDSKFNQRLQQTYEGTSNFSGATGDMHGLDELDLDSASNALNEPEDLLEADDDAPIIRLINALLAEAIKQGASDIHVEPFENHVAIRLRIDGVLKEVLNPRREIAPLLISRIKVMAKLDIAEKRLPQDGRISLRIAGRAVDVRVSSLPSAHGERVVMRLLDKQAGRLNLSQLGMEANTYARIQNVISKPHGILLVTGPTGSGKTTSLYASLEELNDNKRNIMTVEDPVEYFINGISQTQVNPKVDMTFARGLRAILRQDPDVVMIGEIRDLETAEIAVQASLTGHMVFSTLHTNTAVGAVTRLRDMGVEPFLLSSSLIGLVAQRLVRTLNPENIEYYTASLAECQILGVDPDKPPTLARPASTEHADFKGRSGIYELVTIDKTMQQMIHDGASEHTMELHARQQGHSLTEDGYRLVLEGRTTLDEVLRVTREN